MRFNINKTPVKCLIMLGIMAPEILFTILDLLKKEQDQKFFLNLRLVSRRLVEIVPNWLNSRRITSMIADYRKTLLKSLTPQNFFLSSGGDPKCQLTFFEKLTWKERALRSARRRWLIDEDQLNQKLQELAEERKYSRRRLKRIKKDYPNL